MDLTLVCKCRLGIEGWKEGRKCDMLNWQRQMGERHKGEVTEVERRGEMTELRECGSILSLNFAEFTI